MKKNVCRILAWVMALCMMVQIGAVDVSAAQITQDGHVISRPELLEQFEFPNNWARPALEFAVGNGILKGRENGLAENANTTRAETAALLVRLLGAQGKDTGLDQYTDVDPDKWYYPELAVAVELGIMKGTSDTTLSPNAPITREQVFTLLSRAFGIYCADSKRWREFTDGMDSSAYARSAISALADRGYLKGYEDGSMRPKQYITRAELAQLFYGLFTCICDDAQTLPESGRVLYRGTEAIAGGYTLDGDLMIGCGLEGNVELKELQIHGMLALRMGPDTKVTLTDCAVDSLSVSGPEAVTGNQPVAQLFAASKGAELAVPAENVYAYGDCLLNADCTNLYLPENGVSVTLNAAAENGILLGNNTALDGTGSAKTVDIYGENGTVTLKADTLTDHRANDYENALSTVETIVVWDTVIKDTYLYSSSDLYGTIRFLPAGTKLEHYYYREGSVSAPVYTEDGVFGYVARNCIEIPAQLDIRREPYSKATMEGFVNQKGYSSSTGYLLWVNLKTQTVNVFTGSKGNWSLYRSFPCCSGKPSQPTVIGTFQVQYKHGEWNFGSYKVKYVTGFYEGYAFHSRTYSPDYTKMLDPTLGYPASAGCLRMADSDCKYICDYIPYGTTVVVY